MQHNRITENNSSAYQLQLTLTDLSGSHQFFTSHIIRMEACNNYTIVYSNGRRPFVVSKVLKIYEELLKPFGFVRTHRSHLINKQFIRCVERNTIIMQDASIAKMAREKRTSVIKQLGN